VATSYEDLVTAATVGLARRPVAIEALDGPAGGHHAVITQGDAVDALLDAAALLTVARRAGAVPVRGVELPPPMPADTAPELPPRAVQVLRRVTGDPDLLADLLTATAKAGLRTPAPLLPALLDAAVRTVALRPAVRATLGARGRWLAGHRAEWRRVTEEAVGQAGIAEGAADPRTWETGTRAERVAYLAALRDQDPLVARELLAAGWAREGADDRAQLLAVLSRSLSPADEKFLETMLGDRAAAVRATARGLLARLPGSAFSRRAADRTASVLSLHADGGRRWLAACLPPDTAGLPAAVRAAHERDGIPGAVPPPGIGAGAWHLTRIVAAAPLSTWTGRFGMSAREIAALPITGDLALEVHGGWRLAAVSQGSTEWATALLTGEAPLLAPGRPQAAWAGNHELAAVLDPAARAALAYRAFTRIAQAARAMEATKAGNQASAIAIAEFTEWPGPWPDAVADYVLDIVTASIAAQGTVRVLRDLLASAARRIPVTGPRDYGAALARLAQSTDCAYPWIAVLRRAADTLALRRAFQAAITESSPAHGLACVIEP
jgi:hypothetical protein